MKKIYYILTILLCVYVQTANAQMGVNSTGAAPDPSAMLDVRSTNKGFLMPRLTTTQRNAMPAISNGLMIYNTTTNEIEVYRGFAGWVVASRMGVPFQMSGSIAFGGNGIIEATNSGTGDAIRAFALSGASAVYGAGGSTGIYGTTFSLTGTGVYGETNSQRGVWGRGLTTGDGVYGDATSGNGVRGDATTGTGVRGTGVQGIYGDGTTTGVFGTTTGGTGVFGRSDTFRGVWGRGITTGDGVYGDATTGNAVRGEASSSGTGGYFRSVTGEAIDASTGNNFAIRADNNSASTATGSFFNFALGPGVKVIGGANALEITGGIKVSGGANSRAAFKIVSVAGNLFLNQLIIPNTTLANNINDMLIITHNYGAGATNNFVKPCGVYWDGANWTIYVEDGTNMPVGITFNVLVIKQ
jgi:hypothetical protein